MAVTEIHPIRTTLNKALDYISNPDKTDEKLLVSGYACTPETAYWQFGQVKRQAGKEKGILGFHIIQSFSPGEVDYDTAHAIGQELADKIFGGKFQFVCATHIDKGHVHNHIIANSVSFKDYSKFYSQKKTMYTIRNISDKLCSEHGLSVIAEPKEKSKSRYEFIQDKQGRSWKSLLRQNIDKCILKAKDWDEFLALMQREKYEIKQGKYISFRADCQERFIRAKSLGENYTEENIRSRISGTKRISLKNDNKITLMIDIENCIKNQQKNSAGFEFWAKLNNLKTAAKTINFLTENNLLNYSDLADKIEKLQSDYDGSREKIKAVEKRIKTLDENIHNIDCYRKNKPISDKLQTVVFKERFRKENEAELIIFNAAEKYIKSHFKGEKLPLIKDLRTEQKALTGEKEKLYKQYDSAKQQLLEVELMKKNVDMILGKDFEMRQSRSHSTELE